MSDIIDTIINEAAIKQQIETLTKGLADIQAAIVASISTAADFNKELANSKNYVEMAKAQQEYSKAMNAAHAAAEKKAKVSADLKMAEEKAAAAEKALSDALKNNANSIKEAREQNKLLTAARNAVDVSTEAGRKKLETYNKKLDGNNRFIKENADANLKQKMNIGNYASALEGLPGMLGKVGQATGGITAGIGGMIKASLKFIMTPLGAVLLAVSLALQAVFSWFRRTEEGGNKLAVISAVLGSVLQSLMDILSKVGEAIFSVAEGVWNFVTNLISKK